MTSPEIPLTTLDDATVAKARLKTSQLEAELIRYAEAMALHKPMEVLLRNGVEWTADMAEFANEIVHRPVPLRDYERTAIREIVNGDPLGLLGLRDFLKPVVLDGLWRWGAEKALLRSVIEQIWEHDYREIFAFFQRREHRAVFEAASFPVDHLPQRITIYRGIAVGEHEKPPCSGIAWTLRRDLACWFAVHIPGPGGSAMFPIPASCKPHLLMATVRRERVAAHLRGRNEDEIIIFGMSVRTVSVMSDEHDIRERAAREDEAKNRASDAM